MELNSPPLALFGAIAAVSLTASAASAQAAFTHVAHPHDFLDGKSPATTTVTGRFTDHQALDAAVLYGAEIIVFKAPEVYTAPIEGDLGFHVSDIATLPVASGGEELLAVGSGEVVTADWDGTKFVTTSLLGTLTHFAGAHTLGVADLNDDQLPDAFASDSTHRDVVRALGAAGGGFSASTVFASFPSDILELKVLEWDAARTGLELVVLTAGRAYVLDGVTGALITDYAVWGAGVLEAVPLGTGEDAMVFVAPFGNGSLLAMVSEHGAPQSLVLDYKDVVSIDCIADPNLVTLAISAQSETELRVLKTTVHPTLGLRFTLTDEILDVPDWSSASANVAQVAVADFDSDGDQDLFFPAVGTNHAELFRGTLFDEDQQTPMPQGVTFDSDTTGVTFTVFINVPYVHPNEPDVEFTVWRQSRFNHYLDPEPVVPPTRLAPGDDPSVYIPSISSTDLVVEFDRPFQQYFEEVYHIEVRSIDASGDSSPGNAIAVGLRSGSTTPDAVVSSPYDDIKFIEGLDDPTIPGQVLFSAAWPATWDFFSPVTPDPAAPGANPLLPSTATGTYPTPLLAGITNGGGSGCLPDIPGSPPNGPPKSP